MDNRPPWWQRLARSPWMRLFAGLGCVLLPVLFVQLLVRLAHLPASVATPIAAVAGTLAALFGYRAFVVWIEQRAATELAPAPMAREWLWGCALGAALMVVTVGLLALLGSYHVDGHVAGFDAMRVMAMPLLASIGAGVVEELVLRGLVFRLVEEALGTWWSLALSALLFGALHLGNPHATLASAAFLVYRRLWLPIGIHAAWNFVQGGVFGVPVSGGDSQGWLQSHLTGPAWLSGGGFGAEATVVAFAACLCAGLLLLRRAYVGGQFIALPRRRAAGSVADHAR
jgi:membrane protease YdiL (CAAX protease family)